MLQILGEHVLEGICLEHPVAQPGPGSASLPTGRVGFVLGDGVRRLLDQGHPCLARACDLTSGLWSTGKLQSGAIWRNITYRKWPRPRSSVIRCSHQLIGGLSVCRSFAEVSPAWLCTMSAVLSANDVDAHNAICRLFLTQLQTLASHNNFNLAYFVLYSSYDQHYFLNHPDFAFHNAACRIQNSK